MTWEDEETTEHPPWTEDYVACAERAQGRTRTDEPKGDRHEPEDHQEL